MRSLIEYLGCGNVYKNKEAVDYIVTKFSDIYEKILPFLKNTLSQGEKSQDFCDFCKVAEIIKINKHLTKEGLEQISNIKSFMNKEINL